jgi:hypothetical protein
MAYPLPGATVGSCRDRLRQLQQSRDQPLRSLEFLLGCHPAADIAVAQQLSPMPVELPSDLLQRGPDVIAAKRSVSAAFSRADEANAAQLLRIGLTAGIIHLQRHVGAAALQQPGLRPGRHLVLTAAPGWQYGKGDHRRDAGAPRRVTGIATAWMAADA